MKEASGGELNANIFLFLLSGVLVEDEIGTTYGHLTKKQSDRMIMT